MRRMIFAAALAALALSVDGAFEHAVFDAVSLDGDWEMAYSPYEYVTVEYPEFSGVKVKGAVPGYWEDLRDEFAAAGMRADFRINPWYSRQEHPIFNYANDTTLPDIYGCFFYRREIRLDATGPAVVRFEGVRNQVHVWINGVFAGFRAGISTPFELAVPAGCLKRGANEIVLAVSNNPNLGYCDYVSGLSTRGLFRSTGGVNGRLELRFVKSDLADVYVTTAADLAAFIVHVGGRDRFFYEIADGADVKASGEAAGDFSLPAAGYEFWSPENPKRYRLRLKTASGSHESLFGIRRLVADGEKFRLNGRPVYLRGVTEHCYFAKTVHMPRDLDYYRMVTRKRKELGFNFVRFHTFVPPAEYLEAADELGMLVHVESPNFVSEPEYAAIIAFARRHPSVVIYCTGNETRIDRIAETYLEDVAKLVHEGTDALFSPMSALRGVEYALVPGKDTIVEKPFPHNPDRMRRLARYCDMFSSYQRGVVSYSSLNHGSPADLDAWGEVYLGKPRTSHEICIDGTYVDLSLERLYGEDSPIVKEGMFSGIRRQLEEKGLIGRADTYFRNSCEWMRRIRKFTFEKLRSSDRTAGYDFLGDINTHWHTFGYSVGMMDEFYRLKPGESAENARRYNSAAVILTDLGSDFNVEAGRPKKVSFSISNYAEDAADAVLEIELHDCSAGAAVWKKSLACGGIPNGKLTALADVDVAVPGSREAKKYLLRARMGKLAENEWEIYAFPPVAEAERPAGARVADDISKAELLAAMERGERVLLLGAGPFNSTPVTYRIGLAGRCSGNYATVIKDGHPALEGMPNEGFCGWQFRRLMEGGAAVQLEGEAPFDPIVDIASSVKRVIRQAMMFEYRVGGGRLLVAAFNFEGSDPAAKWLRRSLVRYVSSDRFNPGQELSPEALGRILDAPLLTGTKDENRARNPEDPASTVRAGKLAQP